MNFLNAFNLKQQHKRWFVWRYVVYAGLIIFLVILFLFFVANSKQAASQRVTHLQSKSRGVLYSNQQGGLFPKKSLAELNLFATIISPEKRWALIGTSTKNIEVTKVNDRIAKKKYTVKKILANQIILLDQKKQTTTLMSI